MIRAGRRVSEGHGPAALVVAVAAAMVLCGGAVSAQVGDVPAVALCAPADCSAVAALAEPSRFVELGSPQPIRDSIGTMDFGAITQVVVTKSPVQPAPRSGRSVGRKVLGAAVGATAGFFAGGYLGAAIEGDSCHCDDPGLKGALIGAPVGAVTGGILGALFLF